MAHLVVLISCTVVVSADEWRCDPIVSPEASTRREQGYAGIVSRYAKDVQELVETMTVSPWLQHNAAFLFADTQAVLEQDEDCGPAAMAARVINEIMHVFERDQVQWKNLLPVFDSLLRVNYTNLAESESSINLVLGSPYPVFGLLASLFKVVPKNPTSTALGICGVYVNRKGKLDKFDWPTFNGLLVEGSRRVLQQGIMPLQAGVTLTEAVRERWFSLYRVPLLHLAAKIADEVFYEYRTEHYEAGCNAGVAVAYLVRSLWFARWDRQAWLQRFISASYSVQLIYVDQPSLSLTNWPVWEFWHMFQLMRRDPLDLPVAPSRVDTVVLATYLHDGVLAAADCYGWMEPYGVLLRDHVRAYGMRFLLLGSCSTCVPYIGAAEGGALEVKYEVLEYFARQNQAILWMDADIGWLQSPMTLIQYSSVLSFAAKDLFGHGVSPALIYVPKNAPPDVAETFAQVGQNLHANPYAYDMPIWDKLLLHEGAEDVGTWDYQGRSEATGAPDSRRLSYWEGPYRELTYEVFDAAVFVSGDGWVYSGQKWKSTVVAFHFLYAHPYSSEFLFQLFYTGKRHEFLDVVWQHRRVPKHFETDKNVETDRPAFVHISYAHGCCKKAMVKNMNSGKEFFDKQIVYGLEDIDKDFRAHNEWIFAQKKGGGLWIWKPYVIYKTLLQVPDNTIVVYLDAGNHWIQDPRPLLMRALNESDLTAPRLGCCFESDWTKRETMVMLGSDMLGVSEKLQIAGYFMAMRKTPLVMEFVQIWLGAVEDLRVVSPDVVTDIDNYPGFIRHMIDQSAFSCLFKKVGFKHLSIREAHEVLKLARWRE